MGADHRALRPLPVSTSCAPVGTISRAGDSALGLEACVSVGPAGHNGQAWTTALTMGGVWAGGLRSGLSRATSCPFCLHVVKWERE